MDRIIEFARRCDVDYIKVSQAAEKWGLSTRRVRVLCAQGKSTVYKGLHRVGI